MGRRSRTERDATAGGRLRTSRPGNGRGRLTQTGAGVSQARRSTVRAAGERESDALARRLGKMIRDARTAQRLTQRQAAQRAGLSQSTWSHLEIGGDGRTTLATWSCAALAVGGRLDAYVREASSAGLPRDAVHLRNQELIIRTAARGGWKALPEQQIDRHAATSRAADVLLHRRRLTRPEYALVEVWDWFDDVGRAVRDWDRRLSAVEAFAIGRMVGDEALPSTAGCWVVRASQRNRRLLAEHGHFFRARFPGSGRAWLTALGDAGAALPADAAIMWASVGGERLYPARLGIAGGALAATRAYRHYR